MVTTKRKLDPFPSIDKSTLRRLLRNYEASSSKEFGSNRVLTLSMRYGDNGTIIGGNAYSITLLNRHLRNEGLRTITPKDMGRIIEEDHIDLTETYVDLGLVVMGKEKALHGTNYEIEKHLGRQVNDRDLDYSLYNPVLIPYSSLDLMLEDGELRFKLLDNEPIYQAKELQYSNAPNWRPMDREFNEFNENGLPIFERQGKFRWTTGSEKELSRFYREGNTFGGDIGRLQESFPNGQIIFAIHE